MEKTIKSKGNKLRLVLKLTVPVLTVAVVAISATVLILDIKLYSNFNSQMSNLLLVIGISAVFILQMLIPFLAEWIFKINISPAISLLFIIHCFGGTYLGNVANMYYIIPVWDKIMHFLMGVNVSMLGFALIQFFSYAKDDTKPIFLAAIVLFTGIALCTLWEVFEFSADVFFNLNMQGYANKTTGELLSGQSALMDTMVDTLLDILGALLVAIPAYFSFKYKKNWNEHCTITRTISRKKAATK